MKKIKYLVWLIIIVLLGILIYENLAYFMTTKALNFDLKMNNWNWTTPEIQNIAYFGICFLLGLILVGIKGFVAKLGLKKKIKSKDTTIASLKQQINTLKTELEVFQHDPYIQKKLAETTKVQQAEDATKQGDKSDTAD